MSVNVAKAYKTLNSLLFIYKNLDPDHIFNI